MPRSKARNMPDGLSKSVPTDDLTAAPPASETGINLAPLILPNLSGIPDTSQLADSAIGFEPNGSLPRVSDAQRTQDRLIYKEQLNAAHNLKDSIGVARGYVQAGTEVANLNTDVVNFATAIQRTETATQKHYQEVKRTELEGAKLIGLGLDVLKQNASNAAEQAVLTQLEMKATHQQSKIGLLERKLEGDLTLFASEAEESIRKASEHRQIVEQSLSLIDL